MFQKDLELAMGRARLGRSIRHVMICGHLKDSEVSDISRMAETQDADLIRVEGVGVLKQLTSGIDAAENVVDPFFLREMFRDFVSDKKTQGRVVLVFAKGLDLVSKEELGELIEIAHDANQKTSPMVLIGEAGPDARRLCGDARSYSERMFSFHQPDTSPSPPWG